MKRMRPEAYAGEANHRANVLILDFIARYGTWNAEKILDKMIPLLRTRRDELCRNNKRQRCLRKSLRKSRTDDDHTGLMPDASGISG